jgi:hypothetical protein
MPPPAAPRCIASPAPKLSTFRQQKSLDFFKIKAFLELDERFELSTLLLQGFASPASPPLSRPFGGGGHLFLL